MGKITKSSFFLTVFGVSLIWFSITLMILIFHEDMVSARNIKANLEIQEELESVDHFNKVHKKSKITMEAPRGHILPEVEEKLQRKEPVNPEVNNFRKMHKKKRPIAMKAPRDNTSPNIIENPIRKGPAIPVGNIHQRLPALKSNTLLNNSKSDSKRNLMKHLINRDFKPINRDQKNYQHEKRDSAVIREIPSVTVSELERLKHLDAIAPLDAPGEMGNAVEINTASLTPEEKKRYDALFKLNSFSQYTSDKISLHRRLVDIRNDQCKAKKYQKELPNTSIIICFHNEAWSVLLRSVHSALDRSPPELIHEIILVDDFSDLDHLKKPLDDYVATLKKVRVLRTKKREGLVRARLLGYSISTGDTLTFLDSHIECFPGWLEPLLDRVATNSTIVVAPLIPMISAHTFGTQKGSAVLSSVGGFDIDKVSFNWAQVPPQFKQVQSYADPTKSPTIAGGLFTISRDFFTRIGTYDEGMNIWGGENLELSFRVWMCGGSLEIHPCSCVGHVFRGTSPYKWGESFFNIIRHNAVRVAEVWMDDYKNFYFEKLNFNLGNYGDVSARKELRKRLKCHSFDWYIKNVYPNIRLPNKSVYAGEIKSAQDKAVCLDSMGGKNERTEVVGQPCHGLGGNQFFKIIATGIIEGNDGCLDYNLHEGKLHIKRRTNTCQVWVYTQDQQLKLKNWDLCLELTEDKRTLALRNCKTDSSQKWTWTKKYSDL